MKNTTDNGGIPNCLRIWQIFFSWKMSYFGWLFRLFFFQHAHFLAVTGKNTVHSNSFTIHRKKRHVLSPQRSFYCWNKPRGVVCISRIFPPFLAKKWSSLYRSITLSSAIFHCSTSFNTPIKKYIKYNEAKRAGKKLDFYFSPIL